MRTASVLPDAMESDRSAAGVAAGLPRLFGRLRKRTVAVAVFQFAFSGLAALLLVGVGALFVAREAGGDEAVRDARSITRVLATGVVEPQLTDGVLRGNRAALARLDRIVHSRVLKPPVVRVKLWTPSGRIAYSDEPRLINARYGLGEDERNVLATGKVEAEISDLSRPENRFERSHKKLLEVYLPVKTQRGKPLLFEAYLRFSSVAASGHRIWTAFVPALIGALLLLWVVQIPLAWALARRLQRGRRERERLLERAVEASDLERRRIAADLHDGVVQDLAGITFALSGAADRPEARGTELGRALSRAAAGTRQSMRRLRSLLVEIYPPSLETEGLEPALADLLAPLAAKAIATRLDVPSGLRLAPAIEQLCFRTAQEALRNTLEHADATQVTVRVRAAGGRVTLLVEDDGRGFDAERLEHRRREGHIGLNLLRGQIADLGGTLEVASVPGQGTRVHMEVGEE